MRRRPVNRPTAVDLFCGVGGLSLGLIQAGFDILGAIDSDRKVLEAFRKNLPDVPTAELDLSTASAKKMSLNLALPEKRLGLLVGGPPCQGFSFGGVGAKLDPRNEGVLTFARLVSELQPRYFVMENVRGFLASKHTATRRRFCKSVTEAGYSVLLPIKALNAADYGVPQRRIRAFVIGYRNGEAAPEYPEPHNGAGPSVRDAIGDLAFVDQHSSDYEVDYYNGPLGPSSEFALPLRRNRSGRLVRRLTGCLRTQHSLPVVARFRATCPGEQETISRYYRLDWNGVSPTLRAGTGPDHGSHTAPRPIHPTRPRCITVREAARLHSFPDWFKFDPTKWHGFRQIGNSVPPLLAQAVVAKIFELLTKHNPDGVVHAEQNERRR